MFPHCPIADWENRRSIFNDSIPTAENRVGKRGLPCMEPRVNGETAPVFTMGFLPENSPRQSAVPRSVCAETHQLNLSLRSVNPVERESNSGERSDLGVLGKRRRESVEGCPSKRPRHLNPYLWIPIGKTGAKTVSRVNKSWNIVDQTTDYSSKPRNTCDPRIRRNFARKLNALIFAHNNVPSFGHFELSKIDYLQNGYQSEHIKSTLDKIWLTFYNLSKIQKLSPSISDISEEFHDDKLIVETDLNIHQEYDSLIKQFNQIALLTPQKQLGIDEIPQIDLRYKVDSMFMEIKGAFEKLKKDITNGCKQNRW